MILCRTHWASAVRVCKLCPIFTRYWNMCLSFTSPFGLVRSVLIHNLFILTSRNPTSTNSVKWVPHGSHMTIMWLAFRRSLSLSWSWTLPTRSLSSSKTRPRGIQTLSYWRCVGVNINWITVHVCDLRMVVVEGFLWNLRCKSWENIELSLSFAEIESFSVCSYLLHLQP